MKILKLLHLGSSKRSEGVMPMKKYKNIQNEKEEMEQE
jgi:hypothetical protein